MRLAVGAGTPYLTLGLYRRLALRSLRVLVESLHTVPDSKEKATVLAGVHECREAVEQWHNQSPASAENRQVMSRILKLHVAATWLRRR
jgi:hypothetical protein